jgi:hypothetical protein
MSDTPEPPSTTAKPYQQNFRQTVQKGTELAFAEPLNNPGIGAVFLSDLAHPGEAFQ